MLVVPNVFSGPWHKTVFNAIYDSNEALDFQKYYEFLVMVNVGNVWYQQYKNKFLDALYVAQ